MSKKFTAVRLLCAFGIAFVLTVAIIFGVSEEPVTAIYNQIERASCRERV